MPGVCLMLLPWLSTCWKFFNKVHPLHTTFILELFFKNWYERTIYIVLSILHQGLSHQLVANNNHSPSTKDTKTENVSIFLCKLNKDSRLVFCLNTELITDTFWGWKLISLAIASTLQTCTRSAWVTVLSLDLTASLFRFKVTLSLFVIRFDKFINTCIWLTINILLK